MKNTMKEKKEGSIIPFYKDESTVAHELGHTGGLWHPDAKPMFMGLIGPPKNQQLKKGEDEDNVMYSGTYGIFTNRHKLPKKINANQASILYKNYKKGKLNRQNNYYRSKRTGTILKLYPGLGPR